MSHKTARQWLETLIAFDTTTVKSNIALIECVASYLESCGVKPLILRSPDGIHANLLATLPAADGNTTGGLVLSGHSDVVPVTGQKWDSDPFKLTERDGKLYGRGSCDMKGYIAIVLSLVPEWLEKPRSKPLHIALTHSEETNFDGIREMLKEKGTELAKCDGCIIGEPTMLEIVIAHKGICGCAVSVKGKAAHSSLPADGYNAMDAARQVLNGVFDMRDDYEQNGPFDHEFPIPFTSVCPTTIEGGNSTNTIPANVSLTFEYRNLPCHDGEEILSRVRRIVAEADAQAKAKCAEASVTLDQVDDAPNFNGDPNAAVVKALQTALNTDAAPLKLGMSTEAGEYEQVGLRAVVCGPGSLEQAHKANEFISVEQFEKGLDVIRKAVDIMCPH